MDANDKIVTAYQLSRKDYNQQVRDLRARLRKADALARKADYSTRFIKSELLDNRAAREGLGPYVGRWTGKGALTGAGIGLVKGITDAVTHQGNIGDIPLSAIALAGAGALGGAIGSTAVYNKARNYPAEVIYAKEAALKDRNAMLMAAEARKQQLYAQKAQLDAMMEQANNPQVDDVALQDGEMIEYFSEGGNMGKMDFSEKVDFIAKNFAVELNSKDMKRFENAKTNLIVNEVFFPSRKAKKFKFDVEREALYNDLLNNYNGNKKAELMAQKAAIDAANNEGMGFLPATFWYGKTGAAYHTNKKNVKQFTNLLNQMQGSGQFAENDPTVAQKVLFHTFGLYPKKNTGESRTAYFDAVKSVAALSPEQRGLFYEDLDKNAKVRSGLDWGSAIAGSIIPGGQIIGLANNVAQDVTIANKYKDIASKAMKAKKK